MFAIAFSIFAIVLCVIGVAIDIIVKQYGWALVMLILIMFNTVGLKLNIDRFEENKQKELESPKIEQVDVSNIINYQIDSIEIVHGTDTTKTYDITYWIEK